MPLTGDFKKNRDFCVCVDSDGTVMDTMWVKHSRCLAPALIEEWALESWREPVLKLWYDINLYRMTRGVIRYRALALALRAIHDGITPIEGVDEFEAWVDNGGTLSVETLANMAAKSASPVFRKALNWTQQVNRLVGEISLRDKPPFPGAGEGLQKAKFFADLAVISTANRDALTEEWQSCGFLPWVDALLAQDSGSKSACIAALLEQGYAPEHLLMIGDAPSDLAAARANGVFFYPILVGHERESWEELCKNGYGAFLGGDYENYEAQKLREFYQYLGG